MPKKNKAQSQLSRITACIICEIARKENGQKDNLLGVFPKSIQVPQLPAMLPNLAIWLEVVPASDYMEIDFSISNPDGKEIIKGKGQVELQSRDEYAVGLPLQLHAITFKAPGIYQVKVGINGPMK